MPKLSEWASQPVNERARRCNSLSCVQVRWKLSSIMLKRCFFRVRFCSQIVLCTVNVCVCVYAQAMKVILCLHTKYTWIFIWLRKWLFSQKFKVYCHLIYYGPNVFNYVYTCSGFINSISPKSHPHAYVCMRLRGKLTIS